MDPASTYSSTSSTRAETWSFVWSWLLGFGLVVYLGLNGGGFDPLISNQAGIVVWWLLLLGVAVGALPHRRLSPLALCALGLFAGLVLWTGLSLRWTESTEKTAADLARMATLLGVFALAALSRGRRSPAQMGAALASGVAVIAVVALLSRLHPSWFPDAAETGRFLTTGKERLSYPLDYWNGLAALIGIGLPLMAQVAANARSIAAKALAAASLPALALALFLTLSRAGIAASLMGLGIFLVLTRDRIPQALTLLVSGVGAAVLIVLALGRDELVHGLTNMTARSQGDELLWITVGVCVLVGLTQAAIALAQRNRARPGWTVVSQRQSLIASGALALVLLIALIAIDAPGGLANAWDDFREPSGHSEKGTSRLTSVGGENRYQLWSSAVREFEEDPLLGTGSGTFQLWWTRDGDVGEPIVDTHALYLQVLGELGIVGLALLLAFVLVSYWTGLRTVLRATTSRPPLAAAVAGSTVLWISSIVDWTWKIPIIPIAAMLLIAVFVTAGNTKTDGPAALSVPLRVGAVVAAVLTLIAIAIPLASTSLLRQSQADARDGNLPSALEDARSARNVQPGAATPRLQEALLLETMGDYGNAAIAARAATEREPTSWRLWLVLSRVEAQRGRTQAALVAYREARSLNPLSPIFAGS